MDYTFLSKEEFLALEKSGDLLESGVYEGKRSSKETFETKEECLAWTVRNVLLWLI